MPGVTFTLSEFPFESIELACGASGAGDYERRGLWSGTGLTMRRRDQGLPQVRQLARPCRAYYLGLTEWWEKQPREAGLGEPDRKQPGDVAAAGVC
jgi:hypothetical protein